MDRERIKTRFLQFVQQHCVQGQGFWSQVDIIHAAFGDFCLDVGENIQFINSLVKPFLVVDLAVELGAKIRGSRNCVVLSGVQLTSYPGSRHSATPSTR
jgi:hypothetical protein